VSALRRFPIAAAQKTRNALEPVLLLKVFVMEKSSKRGKIPQSDWPLIMARYEAGETLSSIARTYDCSPPAISYVVSRSRARPAAAASQPAMTNTEPQLVKSSPANAAALNGRPAAASPSSAESTPNGTDAVEPPQLNGSFGQSSFGQSSFEKPEFDRGDDPRRGVNGAGRSGASSLLPMPHPATHVDRTDGDARRVLHSALDHGSHAGNGAQANDSHAPEHRTPQRAIDHAQERFVAHPAPVTPAVAGVPEHRDSVAAASALFGTERPVPTFGRANSGGNGSTQKEGAGSFIDRELRARVESDITVFLAAFDAALVQDSQENRSALREATDRLLRAGARTRIELERLEARLPLPPRDPVPHPQPSWRPR
jgi:hypothetical protein